MFRFSIQSDPVYRLDIYDDIGFSNDVCQHATQSYGLITQNNHILIVHNSKEDYWMLPGGTIELGETPERCLIREVYEESAVVIDPSSIKPSFYQKVFKKLDIDKEFGFISNQLRFFATPKKIEEFTGDPDGTVDRIKWVFFDQLGNYLKWGKTTPFIQELLKR
jgi:8-oxo-dGTP pyrophosphatase MutT (NUDIX family)